MTKHAPDTIEQLNDMPQWAIDEALDRDAMDAEEAFAPVDEDYFRWVASWEQDEQRPGFTNGFRYNDHGAMPTLRPCFTRTTIDQHINNGI